MKRKEYAVISVMIGILLFPALSGAVPAGVTEQSDLTTLSTALIEETGVLLVDFVDDASPETIAAVAREYGLVLRPNSIFSGAEKLMRAEVARSRLPGLVERLSHDPRVEIAEPEMIYAIPRGAKIPSNEGGEEPEGFPNDPLFKYQWHMTQIKVQEAWKRSKGEDVVVAVIDTGVAYENRENFHRVEDLEKTAFVPGYDFIHDTEHANDDNCHGTHVAGTIAQSTHNGKGVAGVAFKAKIMPIKVLTAQGFGTTADIAEGIRYAADHGAKVINMSLGGPYPSKIMADACKYAHQKGVTIVCAAGNSGSRKVGYPAAYPECIAVSA
ncbi:MAG: peptidase S8, partial [Deltaproteobacteria bacterium]